MRLPHIFPLIAAALALIPAYAFSDSPFPDTPANHWVYSSMIQIRKDKLWYRGKDHLPKRKVLTRMDFGTKTYYLAIDSQRLIEKFRQTTNLLAKKPDNAATRKWAAQYRASFAKKKLLYQTYLQRVTRLWKFFPEARQIAKQMNVDPKLVTQNLALEKITLNSIRLPALKPQSTPRVKRSRPKK